MINLNDSLLTEVLPAVPKAERLTKRQAKQILFFVGNKISAGYKLTEGDWDMVKTAKEILGTRATRNRFGTNLVTVK